MFETGTNDRMAARRLRAAASFAVPVWMLVDVVRERKKEDKTYEGLDKTMIALTLFLVGVDLILVLHFVGIAAGIK
jgi:hypothetical protein